MRRVAKDRLPNNRFEANRRHAHLIGMSEEPERASCAQPFLSAAVAHPQRSLKK